MDWALAIRINREALLGVLAGLFAMIGGAAVSVLPRRERLAILAELRAAEAALRRLVAVLADDLAVPERPVRSAPAGPIPAGNPDREHVPAFPLFDPRRRVGPVVKRVPGQGPGVRNFDDVQHFVPVPPGASPDDLVDAGRLWARLLSARRALDDLSREARRLARMLAKQTKPVRVMRPGRPPGHVARGRRPVDIILAECQELALLKLAPP